MFRPALGPTQPPIQWVPGALSKRIKRPLLEAYHSRPSIAEVKNGSAQLSKLSDDSVSYESLYAVVGRCLLAGRETTAPQCWQGMMQASQQTIGRVGNACSKKKKK
jgi:hypothetical protein